MATIALLTRGKVAGRTGPSSAWYEIGRNNALAEALTLRGHRVAMWWDEPHGELLCDSIDLAVLRSGGPLNIERARVLRDSGAVVLNDPDAHWTASDKWATVASSNSVRKGRLREKLWLIREITWVASRECPPASKKLS